MKSCKIGTTRALEDASTYEIIVGGPKSPVIRAYYRCEDETYVSTVGTSILSADELDMLRADGYNVNVFPVTIISGDTHIFLYRWGFGFLAASDEKVFIFRGSDLLSSVLSKMKSGGCTITANKSYQDVK